jgi:hypothetical protein
MRTDRPFAWLQDRHHLRSDLARLERAIRAGNLDDMPPERRAELMKALRSLHDDPGLSPRVAHRLASVTRTLGGLS